MGTNSDISINVTTTNTGQGTTEGTGQGKDSGNAVETLTVLMQLLSQGKKLDGAPATESTTGKQETLELIIKTGSEKTTIDITIDNPTLPMANDAIVALAIDIIATNALGDDHPLSILIKATTDQITANANADGAGDVDGTKKASGAGGPVPPHLACAFLGGLVMVALAEILANYAKQQSSMEKEMATLWAKTESMLKDLAQCMAQNILEKASTQATSEILQAVMSGIGAGISIGGAMGSLHLMGQAEKEFGDLEKAGADVATKSFRSQVSQTRISAVGTISQSTGSIFSGAATDIVKAWEALAVGNFDAREKIMENVQQQLQAMVEKYNTGESDAKSAVDKALDLLKNMMDALAQAFKGLGGGH